MVLLCSRGTLLIWALLLVSVVKTWPSSRSSYTSETTGDPSNVTVVTKYGGLRGHSYNITDNVQLGVFLGVPYARPPVGDLRFARPEPIPFWAPKVRDATVHGDKCIQRIIKEDPVLANVPFSEDCLFVDIYTTGLEPAPSTAQPVMVYIHPGGFYGGSGAKYNFTNLALRGVVVVSVSYRLDAFGFLSLQDDTIPGNFGLLDTVLALSFVKEIIGDFGGNPRDITLFGASAGAAMVSLFTLSPLTRGTFQKAIMQSGAALCPWATFNKDLTQRMPRDMTLQLGKRLNCSVGPPDVNHGNKEGPLSRDLLSCLRAIPAETLIKESVYLQEQVYGGSSLFVPVVGDVFGVIPETPEQLLEKTDELVAIPTIFGYTTDDGSWLVHDPENDGVTFGEFRTTVRAFVTTGFAPREREAVFDRVMTLYLPSSPSELTPLELRAVLVRLATDYSMEAFIVKQARMFSKAKRHGDEASTNSSPGQSSSPTFVYEFGYRPSYSSAPVWQGVSHADEKGFVLGLPPGPYPFNYPNTTADDHTVADIATQMWTNFAKFGHPTPPEHDNPVPGVSLWPEMGHFKNNQNVLTIRPRPEVKRFDRDAAVVAWTGDSGLVSVSVTGSGSKSDLERIGSPLLVSLSIVSGVVLSVIIYMGYRRLTSKGYFEVRQQP